MISIIIPVYNNKEKLERCIESIKKSYYTNYEIIVVDDHSSENIENICIKQNIRYLLNNKKGPGSARNLGASIEKYNLLFFLDSDTEIFENSLNEIAEWIEKNPDLKVTSIPYNYKPINSGSTSAYKALTQWFHFLNNEKVKEIQGGACLFQKNFFLQTGGWNIEFFFASVENEEFGERIYYIMKDRIPVCRVTTVKHNFNNFFTCIKNTFKRADDWYFFYKRGYITLIDSTQPSKNMAIFNMLGILSLLFLAASLLCNLYIIIFFFFTAIPYLIYYRKLFYTAAKLHGIIFMFFSIFFTIFISIIGYSGALSGYLKFQNYKLSKL